MWNPSCTVCQEGDMYSRSQVLIGLVVLVGILGMVVLVTFHLDEVFALRVGQFAPLLGAFIGVGLALIKLTLPTPTKAALHLNERASISRRFHEQEGTYRSLIGRVSQLVVGLGLSLFVVSAFIFHIQQHVGMSVESPWIDLGRFLGLITIGIAAYVGRFPLDRRERHQRRPEEDLRNHLLSPLQFIPYGLLVWLFVVVIHNIVATDSLQQAIRPVLLLSALTVFGLVMVRQLVTIRENRRVAQQQAKALEQLTQANRQMEEQAQQTAEQQTELERGIEHLRNVQASLANSDPLA